MLFAVKKVTIFTHGFIDFKKGMKENDVVGARAGPVHPIPRYGVGRAPRMTTEAF